MEHIKEFKRIMYEAFDKKDLKKIKKLSLQTNELGDIELVTDLLIYLIESNNDILRFFLNEIDINVEIGIDTAWVNIICTRAVNSDKILDILAHVKNINFVDVYGDNVLSMLIDDIHADELNKVDDIHYHEQFMNKIKILLEHGADPHIKNNYGRTAIGATLVLEILMTMELLTLLLNFNPDKKVETTTLVWAVKTKSKYKYDMIELLLNYIKDINDPLPSGQSILNLAKTELIDTDIIELLEMHGAH